MNDKSHDQQGQPDSSTTVGKDEKEVTNPNRPQPTGKDEPPAEPIEKVETDVLIEDRFEATDN
jgi:hypothetical protein